MFLKISRSSRPKVFLRKRVLKISSKLTGEQPCRSVISIKLFSNFIEMALSSACLFSCKFPSSFQSNFIEMALGMGSFIKRQTRGTSSDNEWQRVVQRVTTNDNEWQRVVQRVTTNDNEWQQVVQRMTTSGTTSDNEWQRVATSDNKWLWVTASDKKWYNE